MLLFIDVQRWILLPVAGVLRLLTMGASDQTLQSADRVARLAPEGLINAQLWSSLQHQHADARFCEGQGGSPSGGPRPNHDRLEGTLVHADAAVEGHCACLASPRPPGATGDVPIKKPPERWL